MSSSSVGKLLSDSRNQGLPSPVQVLRYALTYLLSQSASLTSISGSFHVFNKKRYWSNSTTNVTYFLILLSYFDCLINIPYRALFHSSIIGFISDPSILEWPLRSDYPASYHTLSHRDRDIHIPVQYPDLYLLRGYSPHSGYNISPLSA